MSRSDKWPIKQEWITLAEEDLLDERLKRVSKIVSDLVDDMGKTSTPPEPSRAVLQQRSGLTEWELTILRFIDRYPLDPDQKLTGHWRYEHGHHILRITLEDGPGTEEHYQVDKDVSEKEIYSQHLSSNHLDWIELVIKQMQKEMEDFID
jgi:Phosphodiesterase/alkaline phosphatase D